MIKIQQDIVVSLSKGFTHSGLPVYFVRPAAECYNRSRKCVGRGKTEKCITRWFYPKVILYTVNGRIIGSNSKENALKEYHRVCELENCKKDFEVTQL